MKNIIAMSSKYIATYYTWKASVTRIKTVFL